MGLERYFEIQEAQRCRVHATGGLEKIVVYWERISFIPRFETLEEALRRRAGLRELTDEKFRVVEITTEVKG